MYQKITMYQTADGKLHAKPRDAARHVETVICDGIRERLIDAVQLHNGLALTKSDIINLTDYLWQNRDSLRALLEFEQYGNDEIDEDGDQ